MYDVCKWKRLAELKIDQKKINIRTNGKYDKNA